MAKRNDSALVLASGGESDLGSLRFHGMEAAKAGGRAVRSGYRRAKPHVERAAKGVRDAAVSGYEFAAPRVRQGATEAWDATKRGAARAKPHVERAARSAWDATKSAAQQGSAAVRTYFAKPNDARFADAPIGRPFALIESHGPGQFSVRDYHASQDAAVRAAAAVGGSHAVVEVPHTKANDRRRAAVEQGGLFEYAARPRPAAPALAPATAQTMERGSRALEMEQALNALLMTITNTSAIYFGPQRQVETSLARKYANGQYRRELAVRAYAPVVDAGVAELRKELRADPDAPRLTLDQVVRDAAAQELVSGFEVEGHGQHWLNAGAKTNDVAAANDLDLWLLGEMFQRGDAVPTRLPPSAMPHVRRLVRSRYVSVSGPRLTITPSGRAALHRAHQRQRGGAKPNHHGGFHAPGDPLGYAPAPAGRRPKANGKLPGPFFAIFPKVGSSAGYLRLIPAPTAADAMEQWVAKEMASDRRFPASYFRDNYYAHEVQP